MHNIPIPTRQWLVPKTTIQTIILFLRRKIYHFISKFLNKKITKSNFEGSRAKRKLVRENKTKTYRIQLLLEDIHVENHYSKATNKPKAIVPVN